MLERKSDRLAEMLSLVASMACASEESVIMISKMRKTLAVRIPLA